MSNPQVSDTPDSHTVIAVFYEPGHARQAIRDLKSAGFRDDQIGVVASHPRAHEHQGTHADDGAVTGAVAGAGVGALWALGIAAGVLPVVGPAIAGGILASVLASAAGGAAVAGILGALVGLGIPEEEARYYEGEFHAGRTLVTVRTDTRPDEAWAILCRHGAYRREAAGAGSVE